ncbi:MAG: hypothetical protein KC416_16500, partial [Myxococcales bacterium]|nr:hypothetical protein [Myxococcales bacterium]
MSFISGGTDRTGIDRRGGAADGRSGPETLVAGAGDDGVEEGATDRAGVDGEAARPAADVGALAAGAGEESARPANRFGSRR